MAGANFVSSPVETDRQDHFDTRLDHRVSDRETIFARYSFVDDSLFTPFAGSSGDSLLPGYGLQVPSRAQNIALGETHIFTPTIVNEVRLAFNRVSNGDFQQGYSNGVGQNLNAGVGLSQVSSNPRDFGLSQISVAGFSPLGDENTSPEHGTTDTYQIGDNATWIRGRHMIKFGADIRILQENAFRDVESRGFINFDGVYTGNPLEELLLGLPTDVGAATMNNPEHLRSHSLDFFVNDTWRVRPISRSRSGCATNIIRPRWMRPIARISTIPPPAAWFRWPEWIPARRLHQRSTIISRRRSDSRGRPKRIPAQCFAPLTEFITINPHSRRAKACISAPRISIWASRSRCRDSSHRRSRTRSCSPSLFPRRRPRSSAICGLLTIQQWNFGIQQQLGGSRVLEVAYVGTKGTDLLIRVTSINPRPR